MAVRQNLYALQNEGHVEAEERPVPIGRPAKHWRLTREADQLFPEAYAELNVSLIQALRDTFGEEGLAQVRREKDGSYLLLENHCPICAAANACQGFCSTELDLFRSVLGRGVAVERVEHIVAGDRRCAYRITPTIAKRGQANA